MQTLSRSTAVLALAAAIVWTVLDRKRPEIHALLEQYGVPVLRATSPANRPGD